MPDATPLWDALVQAWRDAGTDCTIESFPPPGHRGEVGVVHSFCEYAGEGRTFAAVTTRPGMYVWQAGAGGGGATESLSTVATALREYMSHWR